MLKTLTRTKFGQLCDDLIQAKLEPCRKAMQDARLTKNEIDEVILVGGSTRIPAIQKVVETFFGKAPSKGVNPDEVVAVGASIQGGVLTGEVKDVLLLDVTPLNLGIETMGGVMTTLIEANTTIPTKKTEVFSTAVDNQPSVTINVLQGCRPMAKDNKQIGVFNLDGIMPAKRGVPQIEVTFDINANGILSVTAKDKATGKEQNVVIESKGSLSDADIERMKREAEEFAAEDEKFKQDLEKSNKCESLIYSIEEMIKNTEDKLTEEEKTYLNGKADEFRRMKETKSFDNFETVEQEFQTYVYNISSRLYGNGETNTAETQNNAGAQFNGFNTEAGKEMFDDISRVWDMYNDIALNDTSWTTYNWKTDLIDLDTLNVIKNGKDEK
jgi:molecular chaperone DnaK